MTTTRCVIAQKNAALFCSPDTVMVVRSEQDGRNGNEVQDAWRSSEMYTIVGRIPEEKITFGSLGCERGDHVQSVY